MYPRSFAGPSSTRSCLGSASCSPSRSSSPTGRCSSPPAAPTAPTSGHGQRSGATVDASGCTLRSPPAPTTSTPRSCEATPGAARSASISLRRGGGSNACLAWPGQRRSTRPHMQRSSRCEETNDLPRPGR